ncbi:MAG: hypothetical protein Q9M31_08285 [Mariprofundus sp.]|nr:hypothetical protein [Mariprofundus sp.]
MNTNRAEKIAARFQGNFNFLVRPHAKGLVVRYHQHSHYFIRESCFWSYVFKSAGLPFD